MGFYQYNVATLEDGTDVALPASMGCPGSDLGPEQDLQVIALDMLTEHVRQLKAELPANAYRMAEALDYIATHPGCTKADVYRETGVYPKPFGGAPNSLKRLFWRGMIYNLGRCNRAALYIWQPPEQPAGYWRPGHP
jgi:hypothetical protein